MPNDYGIDQYGRPTGSDQTAVPRTGTTDTGTRTGTQCPSGQRYNNVTGRCEVGTGTTPTPQCPSGQKWDTSRYACVPIATTPGPSGSTACPSGQVKNPTTGQCVPPSSLTTPSTTPTTTTQPNTTPSGSGGNTSSLSGNYTAFGRAWLQSGGRTPDDLKRFVAAHPEYGAQIFGSKGDKVRIGGRAYDAVLSAGAGGLGGSWNDITNAGGGSGSSGGGTTASLDDFLNLGGVGYAPTTPPPPAATIQPFSGQPYSPFQFGETRDPFQYGAPSEFNPLSAPGVFEVSPQRHVTSDLISRMLSETSLNDSLVAQLKESQKGTILSGADQLRQQSIQDAARRGVSPGSGALGNRLGDIGSGSLSDISKAYRDIDISKAIQDRIDQQAAVATSQSWQQQLLNEFLGLEGNVRESEQLGLSRDQMMAQDRFGREQAQATENRTLEDQRLAREQAQAADDFRASDAEFQQYLAQQGLTLGAAEQAFSNWLAKEGLIQQYQSMLQLGLITEAQHKLAIARFLSGG